MTKILTHNQLVQEIQNGTLLRGHDPRRPADYVKRTSVDLTIGDIFIPETEADKLGGAQKPRTRHSLKQGQTALVRTKEEILLSDERVGIAFLPSSISMRGALATNPGTVDPGWKGPLHLTIINMGHEPLPLEQGQRLIRVMIFDLGHKPGGQHTGTGADVEQTLSGLSSDFMNLSDRMKDIALKQDLAGRWWQMAVPILVALIAVIGGYYANYSTVDKKIDDKYANIEKKLLEMETQRSLQSVSATISRLSEKVASLDKEVAQVRKGRK